MSIAFELSPRRFVLQRIDDETGTSGTGVVAEGVEFTDGTVAMRWRSMVASHAVFPNMKAAVAIHGHGGKTMIVWLDAEGSFRMSAPPPPSTANVHQPEVAADSEGGEV